MKAEELRIGNKVYSKLTMSYVEVNTRLLRLIESEQKVKGKCEYDPIPLTEEVLLKCGFVLNTKNVDTHSKGYAIYSNNPCLDIFIRVKPTVKYPNDFFSLFNHSMCNKNALQFIRKIKYLHQLQNLYFALTNEELKIEM